jgi:Tfp pilus assembly protein PilF
MRCPKCGFEQSEASECGRCGVIMNRWRAGEAPRTRPTPPPPRRASSSRAGFALLALGLLTTAGLGLLILRRPAASPRPPAASGAVSEAPVEPRPAVATTALPADPPAAPLPSPPLSTGAMAPVAAACPLASGPGVSVPSRPFVSTSWQRGARGFADATQEQARVKAPLLVYFYTDWCRYCREFDRTLLPDSGFGSYRAVRVRVNPEAGREEKALADRFGVTGYPTVYMINAPSVSPAELHLGSRAEKEGPFNFFSGAELVAQCEKQRQRSVAELVYLGFERRQSGDAAGAIRALDEALEMEPEKAEAWLQRGITRQKSGDSDRAYEDYRTALSLKRGYFDVYAEVAIDLGQKGRWDEAAACWTSLLQDTPQEPRAFLERSRAHAHRGDRERAREDAEAACRLGHPRACGWAAALKG